MKTIAVTATTVLLTVLAVIALSQDKPSGLQASHAAGLPPSLDALYPPHAQGPVYLMEMHQLSGPLSGIVCDVMEGDFANVGKNYDAFRAQYERVAKLVPEWADRYPMAPLDVLGKVIATNDPGQIMPAVQGVGQACHTCHMATMPQAQFRYHWPDFRGIAVTDPLSKGDVNFAQLMLMMESNMSGVVNDLGQGQKENAQRQLSGFKARFGALAETCQGCHDTERKYYTSADVTSVFDDLEKALSVEAVDGAAVGQLLEKIGRESCHKCHLVHIPAAYAKSHEAGM